MPFGRRRYKTHTDSLNVVVVSILFPFDDYWLKDKHERKRMAVQELHKGLLRAAEAFAWPTEAFERAYQGVVAKDFDNTRYLGKAKASPNRKAKARLMYEFGPHAITLSIVIFDKEDRELEKNTFAYLLPGWFWLHDAVGKFRWLDSATIRLTSRYGDKTWTVKIPPYGFNNSHE